MIEGKAIASIHGMEPHREGEYPVSYYVAGDVTRIVYRVENYGDHGEGWFDIYHGDRVVSSMNARAVSEVFYEEGEGS